MNISSVSDVITINCRRCGGIIRSSTRFCPYCGLKAPQRPLICPSCGGIVTPGTHYCRNCGKPLDGIPCPRCSRLSRPKSHYCVHCGTSLKKSLTPHPYGTGELPAGQIMGNHYLILRKIAQGGMGAVYEVADMSLSNHRLALKEMSLSVVKDLPRLQRQEVITNFRREFELLRDLQHPNLVQAREYFEENDHQYFVMEYLEGLTLENILENIPANTFLPTERVLEWASQLCDVLSYLHAQTPQIIYRDLKPSNVIEVIDSHNIKIFDFGIARFFKTGKKGDTVAFGTLGYLAPEVAGHLSQTNEKTDVYALGVMLHQFLTNFDPLTDPYQLPSIISINPAVPKNIAKAIEHALETNPDKRTPTITAMLKELCGSKAIPSWKSKPAVSVQPSWPTSAPAQSSLHRAQSQEPLKPELIPGKAIGQAHNRQSLPDGSTPQGDPAYSDLLSISPTSVYLGSVKSGKPAYGTFHLKVTQNVHVQAIPAVPWLVTQPESFSMGEFNVLIIARTGKLFCDPWQSGGQNWFVGLPSWIKKWINFHAFHIIKVQKRHTGSVSLKLAGMAPVEVFISVDVHPPAWNVRLGWGLIATFLLLETALIIVPLIFFAMSML